MPRHSHTACVWKNKVILAGGLDANLLALDIIQILDTQVKIRQIFNRLQRY